MTTVEQDDDAKQWTKRGPQAVHCLMAAVIYEHQGRYWNVWVHPECAIDPEKGDDPWPD